jgi:hypothetical protein
VLPFASRARGFDAEAKGGHNRQDEDEKEQAENGPVAKGDGLGSAFGGRGEAVLCLAGSEDKRAKQGRGEVESEESNAGREECWDGGSAGRLKGCATRGDDGKDEFGGGVEEVRG